MRKRLKCLSYMCLRTSFSEREHKFEIRFFGEPTTGSWSLPADTRSSWMHWNWYAEIWRISWYGLIGSANSKKQFEIVWPAWNCVKKQLGPHSQYLAWNRSTMPVICAFYTQPWLLQDVKSGPMLWWRHALIKHGDCSGTNIPPALSWCFKTIGLRIYNISMHGTYTHACDFLAKEAGPLDSLLVKDASLHTITLIYCARNCSYVARRRKKALTNKETLQRADKGKTIVDQWRSVAGDDGEKQAARVRAVGRLECMICAVALDKKTREFAKMEDAALAVLRECSMEIEKPLDPPQAWVKEASAEPKAKSKAMALEVRTHPSGSTMAKASWRIRWTSWPRWAFRLVSPSRIMMSLERSKKFMTVEWLWCFEVSLKVGR